MKKAYVIAILVMITVAHVLIVGYHRHRRVADALEEYQPPSNDAIEERIGEQVSHLKRLSEIETLRQLDDMEHYLWPGTFIGAETFFRYGADGNIASESLYDQNNIELNKILSNRVFRKSCQDLGKLPKNRASAMLKGELDATLPRYLELYRGSLESQSQYSDLFIIARSKEEIGQPTLLGLRNKLFALVLIAGSLELTEIHDMIQEIDGMARGQKMEISRIEDASVRGSYSLFFLLHNNLVLSSGLFGTSPEKGDVDLKPFADRFSSHKLVDFSAPGTEYDVLVRHGVQELVPDKEYINVRYFDQMTNEDLDELRRILAPINEVELLINQPYPLGELCTVECGASDGESIASSTSH